MEYNNYYKKYIGIDNGKTNVVESIFRDFSINNIFYYPIIKTKFNNMNIYSLSPKIYQEYIKTDSQNIEKFIKDRFDSSNFKTFYRFCKVLLNPEISKKVEIITDKHKQFFMQTGKNLDKEFKEKKWLQLKRYIDKHHVFGIIEDDKIVSMCKISDVYANGANLVVFTDENYRNQKLGKDVVNVAANWCINNSILPIYLVEQNNIASINLVKSLNFELKSTEITMCYIE